MLNHPICEGSYYFEVKILKNERLNASLPNINPHVRVGLATINFNKEIVLGADSFSYSYG